MQDSFYENAIVIDAVCPLLRRRDATTYYKDGGVTAVAPSLVAGYGGSATALKNIGSWTRRIKTSDDLLHVTSANDILTAKETGKLGIIFHFQGTDPIEDDLDLVDAYATLGLRMVLLAYNVKNRVGDGCAERTDGGLSIFGLKLVERLNENGIVVDCSHTGRRTTLDAIEASRAPVVFSHANPIGVTDSPRNITDEQIKAIARTGGLIALAVPLVLVVSLIAFALVFLSGDPAVRIAGESASAADVQTLRVRLGFDRPLIVQYA